MRPGLNLLPLGSKIKVSPRCGKLHSFAPEVMRRFAFALLLLALGPRLLPAQQRAATPEEITALQPGDYLQVEIWREEDLGGQFRVGSDGAVTLPLIGHHQVAGIPFGVVRDTLMQAYQAQLRNPSIVLTPLRRVNVLGEVQKPGLYLVDPTVTLAGAIATAGGATPRGSLNRIRIIREGAVVREKVGAGETLGSADIRSNDQIFVDRRSWLSENLPSVLLGIPSLILTILAISERL